MENDSTDTKNLQNPEKEKNKRTLTVLKTPDTSPQPSPKKKICSKCSFETNSEDFTCAICMEPVVSPTILTCSHMYCIGCIENYAQKGGQECPLCKGPFAAGSRFVINKIMNHIVRDYYKDDPNYMNRVVDHNRTRFVSIAKTIYLDSKRYDTIKCLILDYLLDDGTGFKHYKELTNFVLALYTDVESEVDPNKLMEYHFVLKQLYISDELIFIDDFVIDSCCIEDFVEYYRDELSQNDLLYILSIYTADIVSADTLEDILEKYKKNRKLLSALEAEDPDLDRKVVFLPDVIEAIGVTYDDEILNVNQDKMNKILLSLKAKYEQID